MRMRVLSKKCEKKRFVYRKDASETEKKTSVNQVDRRFLSKTKKFPEISQTFFRQSETVFKLFGQ